LASEAPERFPSAAYTFGPAGLRVFVSRSGRDWTAANHHFLTPSDGRSFSFTEGHYRLDVFARLLGDKKPMRLFSQTLDISREIAGSLKERGAGLYFEWGPDSSRYLPHVEKRPPSADFILAARPKE
jgi:hypothetical protein